MHTIKHTTTNGFNAGCRETAMTLAPLFLMSLHWRIKDCQLLDWPWCPWCPWLSALGDLRAVLWLAAFGIFVAASSKARLPPFCKTGPGLPITTSGTFAAFVLSCIDEGGPGDLDTLPLQGWECSFISADSLERAMAAVGAKQWIYFCGNVGKCDTPTSHIIWRIQSSFTSRHCVWHVQCICAVSHWNVIWLEIWLLHLVTHGDQIAMICNDKHFWSWMTLWTTHTNAAGQHNDVPCQSCHHNTLFGWHGWLFR